MKDSKDVRQVKKGRGGSVKKAPSGYYTAKEAQNKLGMNASTFGYYVRKGKIKKFVPPLRTEGFYEQKEINSLANEMALFLHTSIEERNKVKTRVANEKDTPDIVKVLTVRGWKTATAEQRSSWYKVNPMIDYVVEKDGEVLGYIHAAPYKKDVLEDMMSGKKRSWNIRPEDILPYEKGKEYDLYIGIGTRQDIPDHVQKLGFRLISGFLSFIEELAKEGIFIHHLYAVSAEVEGQKLSKGVGFIQEEAKEGDLFPRFSIDLESSESRFAQTYREIVKRYKKEHKK